MLNAECGMPTITGREALIKFGSLKGTPFRPSVNAQYEVRALALEGRPTDLIKPSLG
jgi:hypothetical protein